MRNRVIVFSAVITALGLVAGVLTGLTIRDRSDSNTTIAETEAAASAADDQPPQDDQLMVFESSVSWPQLEAEAAEADFVAVLPYDAFVHKGLVESGFNEVPANVYEVDLSRALGAAAVTQGFAIPDGPIEVHRNLGYWPPLDELVSSGDVVVLFSFEYRDAYTGHVLRVTPDGRLEGVDGFGSADELEILLGFVEQDLSDLALTLAAYGQAARPLRLDPASLQAAEDANLDGAEILVAIRGDRWPIEPPPQLTVEERWNQRSPLSRNIEPGDAPEGLLAARDRTRLLIQIDGDWLAHEGQLIALRDEIGVLYGFDVGAGPHQEMMWIDPKLEIRVVLTDDERDPDADLLLTTAIAEWGPSPLAAPYGVELIVTLGAVGTAPRVELGRSFADAPAFQAVWNAVAEELASQG